MNIVQLVKHNQLHVFIEKISLCLHEHRPKVQLHFFYGMMQNDSSAVSLKKSVSVATFFVGTCLPLENCYKKG